MTEKEIEETMGLPVDELFELCQSRQILTTVLSLAISNGRREGQCDILANYNTMFKGYNEVTLTN